MYQLPEHAHFYTEIVNMLGKGGSSAGHGTVTVMFSEFDGLALERVVGTARSGKMVTGSAPSFMFV